MNQNKNELKKNRNGFKIYGLKVHLHLYIYIYLKRVLTYSKGINNIWDKIELYNYATL